MKISGPKQPRNDIDVYLSPLIEDLKLMWDYGVEVFDGFAKETFKLHAMLFCTINDFPAYGNLSYYIVKGYKTCPICEEDTASQQLKSRLTSRYVFADLKDENSCLQYKHIDEETWHLFKESRENEAWMVSEVT